MSNRPQPERMTTTISEIAAGDYQTVISAGEIARLEAAGYLVDLDTGAILLDPDADPTPAQKIQALQAAIQALTHTAGMIDLSMLYKLWPALEEAQPADDQPAIRLTFTEWILMDDASEEIARRFYEMGKERQNREAMERIQKQLDQVTAAAPAIDPEFNDWIRGQDVDPELAARFARLYGVIAGPKATTDAERSAAWQRAIDNAAAEMDAEAAGEPPQPVDLIRSAFGDMDGERYTHVADHSDPPQPPEEEPAGDPWHKWRFTVQWLEANGWTIAGTWTDPDSLIRVSSPGGSVYHTSPARAFGFALLEQAGHMERKTGAIRRGQATNIGHRPEIQTPSQIAAPAIEAGSEIWIDVDGAYTMNRAGDLRRYIIDQNGYNNLAEAFRAAAEALRHEDDAGRDHRKAPAVPGYEPMTHDQAMETARQTLASFTKRHSRAITWYANGDAPRGRPAVEITAGWDTDRENPGYFVPIWNVREAGHHLDHFDSLIAALEYIKRRHGCPLGASPIWETLGEIDRTRVIKAAAANVVIYDNGEDISSDHAISGVQTRRQWTIAKRRQDQKDLIILHRYDGSNANTTEAGALAQVIALAYWHAYDPTTAAHLEPLQAARWIDFAATWRITYNVADQRWILAKKSAPATVLRRLAKHEWREAALFMRNFDAIAEAQKKKA